MDLERLQVVISAKTDQLQKALSDIVSRLQNVSKANVDVESSFKQAGDAGADAFNKAIKAVKQYNDEIKQIAQFNARYDIWGGENTTSDKPWFTKIDDNVPITVNNLTKAIEEYKNTIRTIEDKPPSDTLGFGLMNKEIGDAEDAIKRYNAVINELFKDQKGDQELKMTADLEALAVKSAEVKEQLASLYEDMKLIRKVESGEMEAYPGIMNDIERYNTLDVDDIKKKYSDLTAQYSSIRREIDETIKAMGGLTVEAEAGTSAFMSFANAATTVALVIAKVAKVAWQVGSAIAKVTNEIGKVLWKIEPVHKALGKIGASIQSLWTRIKRVLVYSTIVSFFNEVKSHIKGYLSANKELMSALGEAKGAWITAFMPVLNFVIPKIIALIN